MPYVGRNEQGRIVTVSTEVSAEAAEFIDAGTAELRYYLSQFLPPNVDDLVRSDQDLIRVVEDVVDTLIEKNLIRFTDLPEAAQNKLVRRRSLRHSRSALSLLDEEEIKTFPSIKL
jgi:hypothetical protein